MLEMTGDHLQIWPASNRDKLVFNAPLILFLEKYSRPRPALNPANTEGSGTTVKLRSSK
jgi:hypothetical protein